MQHLSFEELCERAELIVRGTVLASASHTESSGRILTHHRLRIAKTYKAPRGDNKNGDGDDDDDGNDRDDAFAPGSRITVLTLGGSDGERRQHVPGEARLSRGNEVVLFLRPTDEHWRTVGLAQGALHCQRSTEAENDARCNMHLKQRLTGLTLVTDTGEPAQNAQPLRLTYKRFQENLNAHMQTNQDDDDAAAPKPTGFARGSNGDSHVARGSNVDSHVARGPNVDSHVARGSNGDLHATHGRSPWAWGDSIPACKRN